MKEIDVNNHRNLFIKMFPNADFEKSYTFYYDETNNLRKLHLQKEDFNASFRSNFILGGLVFEGQAESLDELFDGLNLQKNISDVKLKHLAHGDFVSCLDSEKLNYFLNFLLQKGIIIHFTWINLLYWSVADIVDSAIVNSEVAMSVGRQMADKVKSDFYTFAKLEIESVTELFYRYKYPNIRKEDIIPFIDELIDLFSEYLFDDALHFGLESLRQVLKEARSNESLPFLTGEEDHVLIKDFSSFYVDSICLFKNSFHILDNEESVKNILDGAKLRDGDTELKNYSFLDSKDSRFIQASDIIVGLLGKLTYFMNTNSTEKIVTEIESLNETQRSNVDALINLIDFSVKKNPGFQVMIDCEEETDKFGLIRVIRGL